MGSAFEVVGEGVGRRCVGRGSDQRSLLLLLTGVVGFACVGVGVCGDTVSRFEWHVSVLPVVLWVRACAAGCAYGGLSGVAAC